MTSDMRKIMFIAVMLCVSFAQPMILAQDMKTKICISINDRIETATLVDNAATQAFVDRLGEAPVMVNLNSSGGFEIWGPLEFALPTSDEQVYAQPGDIVLYNGSNICLFYGSNSWSYTRLGHINSLTEEQLRTFLQAGHKNINVTLFLDQTTDLITQKSQVSGATYSLQGQYVSTDHKGVVITNGQKRIQK